MGFGIFDGSVWHRIRSMIRKRFRLAQPINPGLTDSSKYTAVYNPATRQLTITNTGSDVVVAGVRVTPSSEVTAAHADTTGPYYFYYLAGNKTLTVDTSPWDIITKQPIWFEYYNTDQGAPKALDLYELHTTKWGAIHHLTEHFFHGTKYISGMAAADYTLKPAAPADSDNEVSVAAGVIADEDIDWDVTTLPSQGPYGVWYRAGADAANRWDWLDTPVLPFLYAPASYVYYNQNNAGTWQNTALANSNYVNMWELSVMNGGGAQDIVWVMGQAVHTKLASALLETAGNSIDWGDNLPFTEFSFNRMWTLSTGAAYGSSGKCRIEAVTDLRGIVKGGAAVLGTPTSHQTLSDRDAVGAHPADAIEVDTANFAPGETLSAADDEVQQALDTLSDHLHSAQTIAAIGTSAAWAAGGHITMANDKDLLCVVPGGSELFSIAARGDHAYLQHLNTYKQTTGHATPERGADIETRLYVDDNCTAYPINLYSLHRQHVAAGKTNSGYALGFRSHVFRNAMGTADNGTLASMYGAEIYYGHFNTDAAATPQTTLARGLYINPYYMKGTIGTQIDIELGAGSGGGTVTVGYGIRQLNLKQNTFAGVVNLDGGAVLASAKDLLAAVAFGSEIGTEALPFATIWGREFRARRDGANCLNEIYCYSSASWDQYAGTNAHRARGTHAAPTAVLSTDRIRLDSAYAQYDATVGHERLVAADEVGASENHDATHAGTFRNLYNTDNGDVVASAYIKLDGNGEAIRMLRDVELAAAKDLDCYTNGAYFKPRRVSQSAQPTPDANELMVWRDSDDSKTYLVYNDVDEGVRQVEMV